MVSGKPYPVKALITLAKNPLLSMPNGKLILKGMMNLDLHVAMDTFMALTCRFADYVLPSACWLERASTQGGNYALSLQGSETAVEPLYERRAEFYFWRELGVRLGQESYWPWKTLEGFYDDRLAPLGIADGDWIWIETPIGRATFKCRHFDGIAPDVVQAEHGWWYPEDDSLDGVWRSNVNAISDDDPDYCDTVSGNFILRGQRCKVYKA